MFDYFRVFHRKILFPSRELCAFEICVFFRNSVFAVDTWYVPGSMYTMIPRSDEVEYIPRVMRSYDDSNQLLTGGWGSNICSLWAGTRYRYTAKKREATQTRKKKRNRKLQVEQKKNARHSNTDGRKKKRRW